MSNIIYKDELLEHFKDPQNFGELDNYSVKSKITNPFCGDEIEMYLIVQKDKIKEVSFTGQGCVLSISAASLLTEEIKNITLEELKKYQEHNILEMLNVEISETRKKCAMLPLSTIKDCIKHYEDK